MNAKVLIVMHLGDQSVPCSSSRNKCLDNYNLQINKEVNDIILNYIQKRRSSGKKYDDFLQMLLDIRYDDGKGMVDEQLIDEVSILFFAGHETTANALSWAWFLLNKHPDIWSKLRSEVQQVAPDGVVNYERIAQLSAWTKIGLI